MVGHGWQSSLQYGVPVGAHVGVSVGVSVGVPVIVGISDGVLVGVVVAVEVGSTCWIVSGAPLRSTLTHKLPGSGPQLMPGFWHTSMWWTCPGASATVA